MRGTVSHEHPGSGQPDLYFYRDAEEIEKEEQAVAGKAVTQEEFPGLQVPSVAIQQFPSEDCSAQLTTGDWTAASTAQATEQDIRPDNGFAYGISCGVFKMQVLFA
ncbi:hypothetical protein J1605_014373 [Eschrichtius robustus]|uniref:Small ribosomal subunit protein uS2 C-terminal domain-containing protein n=1 Tax=Eschrichtius robustus TaxID=9764 RepID=A0AB34GGR3_ESCRO|nr:hypothetical protein J1605_014373 [Eschrichtius robustus]